MEKADIELRIGDKEIAEDVKAYLKVMKEQGLLDFKSERVRKCDYCNKILKEGDKFESVGDLDKCEECMENESKNIKNKRSR